MRRSRARLAEERCEWFDPRLRLSELLVRDGGPERRECEELPLSKKSSSDPRLDRLSGRLKPSALLDLFGGLGLDLEWLLRSECIEPCPSSSDRLDRLSTRLSPSALLDLG